MIKNFLVTSDCGMFEAKTFVNQTPKALYCLSKIISIVIIGNRTRSTKKFLEEIE